MNQNQFEFWRHRFIISSIKKDFNKLRIQLHIKYGFDSDIEKELSTLHLRLSSLLGNYFTKGI